MEKEYPKLIYVYREEDGDASYLIASEDSEDANDGILAIYELKEMKTKRTETIVE